jgi:hypothetical protein
MPDHSQFSSDRTHPGGWTITFSNPPINMFLPTTIVELGVLMTGPVSPFVWAGRRRWHGGAVQLIVALISEFGADFRRGRDMMAKMAATPGPNRLRGYQGRLTDSQSLMSEKLAPPRLCCERTRPRRRHDYCPTFRATTLIPAQHESSKRLESFL